MHYKIVSAKQLMDDMKKLRYIADPDLATAIYLSFALKKPILLEGEPGCGKTDIARILSVLLSARLIRLQCYEGIDANQALYEWNYSKQILSIRMAENNRTSQLARDIFSDDFLLKRPLLASITSDNDPEPPVLLIDEIDRGDEEFEGLLLEFLSEFQISIPERGTIRAKLPPTVVVTSNRTRELSDALRRRCVFAYIDYPSPEKELSIVRMKVPELDEELGRQICKFMQDLRNNQSIVKKPGVSETLDWARALLALNVEELTDEVVVETVGCITKTVEDKKRLFSEVLRKNPVK